MRLGEYYLSQKEYDSTLFYVKQIQDFGSNVYKGNRLIADAYFFKYANDSSKVYYDKCMKIDPLDKYSQKQLRSIRARIRNKNKPKESSSDNIRNFVEIGTDTLKSDANKTETQPKQEEKKLFDIW